ncbi:MAG: hypothetical protein KF716_15025 [Anaerolineae bacterium]|nr:hypothetical protein [Anaerolineae bacterium]
MNVDNPFQPAAVTLHRGETCFISNAGIIVRTRRHEFFGEFCETLGQFSDRSATYRVPQGTKIDSQGYTYEHLADGGYMCRPRHALNQQPTPAAEAVR